MQHVVVQRAVAAIVAAIGAFFLLGADQRVDIDEARAGLAETLGRLRAAEAIDGIAVLADAHGERHEVAVARHDTETMHAPAIHHVHRVDGHLHVGRVLAPRQVELLLRLDPVPVDEVRPALERRLAPVAVSAADVHLAQFGKHGQDRVDPGRAGIVGIDQEGDISVL